MKKMQIKIFTVVITVLLISNLFSGFINLFTEGLYKTYLYQTENAEFEFTLMPSKGRDVLTMQRHFLKFKKDNPKFSNLNLFRTFKINPLKFWNWYSYITNEMYFFDFKPKIKSEFSKGDLGI